jgi:hypothetical protein
MSDDVQRLRHWQIKDFPEDKRKLVTQEAYRASKTVAAWLEPVIDAALADTERQINAMVTRPVNPANGHATADEVDEVCRLVAAACEFAAHREQMQRDLAASVSRRLRNALEQRQTSLPIEVNRSRQTSEQRADPHELAAPQAVEPSDTNELDAAA